MIFPDPRFHPKRNVRPPAPTPRLRRRVCRRTGYPSGWHKARPRDTERGRHASGGGRFRGPRDVRSPLAEAASAKRVKGTQGDRVPGMIRAREAKSEPESLDVQTWPLNSSTLSAAVEVAGSGGGRSGTPSPTSCAVILPSRVGSVDFRLDRPRRQEYPGASCRCSCPPPDPPGSSFAPHPTDRSGVNTRPEMRADRQATRLPMRPARSVA